VKRSNKNLNEKRLGAFARIKEYGSFCDAATGSPVIEIGYNQLFNVAVPEEVDMATYQ
jgi:hypothetical protein